MPTIGFNHSGTSAGGGHVAQIQAFTAGLLSTGFTVGVNVTLTTLFADDNPVTLAANAHTLATTPVDVLVAAGGSLSAKVAQDETAAIPIVFTSVREPTRPAPNMTGVCARTTQLDVDRLKLLYELRSDLALAQKHFGVLINATRPDLSTQMFELNNAAAMLGLPALNFQPVDRRSGTPVNQQIDAAFLAWHGMTITGVLVAADSLFNNHRQRIVAAAAANNIPTIYQWREFVAQNGLISYGPNLAFAYTLAGIYAGRILNRTAVLDLPILPLDNFQLVINLTTASALPLTVPPALLVRADQVLF